MELSNMEYKQKKLCNWTSEDWFNWHNDRVIFNHVTDVVVFGILVTILIYPYYWIKNKFKRE